MYILEGECEVFYRTAPAPEAPPPTSAQPAAQALPVGSPAAAESAGSSLQQAQQEQQAQHLTTADRSRPPPVPPQVSRRRSAAGLFTGSGDGAPSGAAVTGSQGDSLQSSLAAAGAAALATADTLQSGSLQLETAPAAGKAGHLFTRKTSSFICEAAAAAAEDAGASGAEQAGRPSEQHQHQRQQQQQQRCQQLRVSLPSDAGLLSAEASALSEAAVDSPRRPPPQPGSVAPTPVSAASSLASTPWPAGHQRQHSAVDLEEAAAHLQSPAGLPPQQQEEEGEVDSSRPAGWRRSGGGAVMADVAGGLAVGQGQAQERAVQLRLEHQQQQAERLHGSAQPLQQEAHPPPQQQQWQQQQWHPPRQGAPPLPPAAQQQQSEVVGEELPPTLLEVRMSACVLVQHEMCT